MPPSLPSSRNLKSPKTGGSGAWPALSASSSAKPSKHRMHCPAGAPCGISAPQAEHVRDSAMQSSSANRGEQVADLLAHFLCRRVSQRVAHLFPEPCAKLIAAQPVQSGFERVQV